MKNKFALTLAGLAVLAGSSIAIAADQGHGAAGRRGHDGSAQAEPGRAHFQRGLLGTRGGGDGLGARLERRREAIARRIGQRLDITDAQREQFRAQARSVAPVTEQVRGEARAIFERARAAVQSGGDRAAVREQARGEMKALFQRSFPQLQPAARAMVEQLTPEQRAKLEAAAAARGKTLDQSRLERGAALILMRRARPETQRSQH
jgi:Spy/CpxP family protein refolding chaperone